MASGLTTSLNDQINVNSVECLNADEDSNVALLFSEANQRGIQSDIDPQLLVSIPFRHPVRLSGIQFSYDQDTDPAAIPESIKLFSNRVSLGFSDAESLPALQTLSHSEIVSGEIVPLKLALFQNVVSLQVFVDNNKGCVDKSVLGNIRLFGSLAEKMDMREFKKIKDDE
jgi:hypothetical protein